MDREGPGGPVPEVIRRNCHTCAKELDPVMASLGMLNHPGCDPVPQDIELTSPPATELPTAALVSENPFQPADGSRSCPEPLVAKAVKDELTAMIIWAEQNTDRSLQVRLGPSELGVECDRQLAYRMLGFTGPNLDMADPWPAFVGSSIHTRVEGSVTRYLSAHPLAPKWLIEVDVTADPLIGGHADLVKPPWLVDLKSAGKSKMAEVRKGIIPHGYRVQQHTYAYGLRAMGFDIRSIVLAFLPREGWLRDMFVWAEPYDEAFAVESIARPYRLRDRMIQVGLPGNAKAWNLIEAKPSYMGCQYCPLYDRYVPQELGATDKSCPGYQGGKK